MSATAEERPPSEREEIEMLIPWYVTGRLSPTERQRVDAYITAHPAMRRQIEVALEESGEAIAASEALSGPSRASRDRLFATIAVTPQQITVAQHSQRLADRALERVATWLGGFGRMQLASLATAAALLIVVQGGIIGYFAGQLGQATYETASGPQSGPQTIAKPGEGTFALVSFKAQATSGQVAELLAQNKLEIVEGPRAGGLFKVRLAATKLDRTAADALVARLKQADQIVQFIALQP